MRGPSCIRRHDVSPLCHGPSRRGMISMQRRHLCWNGNLVLRCIHRNGPMRFLFKESIYITAPAEAHGLLNGLSEARAGIFAAALREGRNR